MFGCSFVPSNTIKAQLLINRLEFEKLELQVQQSDLPLKSYLQQIGVSYSTYHYWRRKCSVDGNSIKLELAPISFKQTAIMMKMLCQQPVLVFADIGGRSLSKRKDYTL